MPEWNAWFRLVVAILAVWRIAHLVAHEDGPFDLIVRLRRRAGGGFAGRLMDCPYCLSLWLAVPFAFLLAESAPRWIVAYLAISGGASFLERVGERRRDEAPLE